MSPSTRRRAPAAAAAAPASAEQTHSAGTEQSEEMSPSASPSASALQQRLLWPPAKQDEPVGEQVDLVQVTRLTKKPAVLSGNCGVCFIDNGIRFDPNEFPDNARKTQEKLATKIIESGKNAEHGRTIKVKEYSSKARKRIRFACSREECNVTFQINFDSKKGHWFMKRNKGNFEHTCSALKIAVESAAEEPGCCWTSIDYETCQPVAASEHSDHDVESPWSEPASKDDSLVNESTSLPETEPIRRTCSGVQSLKRCSPELTPYEGVINPKKSRTYDETTAENGDVDHDYGEKLRSSPLPQEAVLPQETSESNITDTPKVRNGSERRKRVRTVKDGYSYSVKPDGSHEDRYAHGYYCRHPSEATAHQEEAAMAPAKETHPSPAVISIYSQDPVQHEDAYDQHSTMIHYSPVRSYPEDMFSRTPPLPSRVMSSHIPNHSLEDLHFPTLSPQVISYMADPYYAPHFLEDSYGVEAAPVARTTEVNSKLLPSIEGALLPSAHLDEEGFEDISFAVPPESNASPTPPGVGPIVDPPAIRHIENAKKSASSSAESVAGSSGKADWKNSGSMETISHKMSSCSLLVAPLVDLGSLGMWTKATRANQGEDDDNSSISTNWSAIAHDFKS